VLVGPAVERQLDGDALVQGFESTHAIGGQMPGDEQHRLHAIASS
jgi:hypothetical protein